MLVYLSLLPRDRWSMHPLEGSQLISPKSSDSSNSICIPWKSKKHTLYYCPKFKGMLQDQRFSVVQNNSLCMNCLHFLHECKSSHHCRSFQRPHHTLLHNDAQTPQPTCCFQQCLHGYSARYSADELPGICKSSRWL